MIGTWQRTPEAIIANRLEGFVREFEDDLVKEAWKDFNARGGSVRTGGSLPNEKALRYSDVTRKAVISGLAAVVAVVRTGTVSQVQQAKTFVTRVGGSPFSPRSPLEDCCAGEPLHGVYVDYGLGVTTLDGTSFRLADPSDASSSSGGAPPTFVNYLISFWWSSSGSSGFKFDPKAFWKWVTEYFAEEYTSFVRSVEKAFEVASAPGSPAEKEASKHWKRLKKSRERAARPDQVAKREAHARTRACESLAALLGGQCKTVLDEWSPQELMSYIRLCQTHGHVLELLKRWSAATPLGSEKIRLEDVEAAISMAKVKDVMVS